MKLNICLCVAVDSSWNLIGNAFSNNPYGVSLSLLPDSNTLVYLPGLMVRENNSHFETIEFYAMNTGTVYFLVRFSFNHY